MLPKTYRKETLILKTRSLRSQVLIRYSIPMTRVQWQITPRNLEGNEHTLLINETSLITDQHFGVRNDNKVFIDKYRDFYSNIVIPYIKTNKITNILCLGDTFDRRKYINFLSLDCAREMWFEPLKELGVHMHMQW